MGTIQITGFQNINAGSEAKRECIFAFGSSYNNTGDDATTGESLRAIDIGLFNITRIEIPPTNGFDFQPLYDTGESLQLPAIARIKVVSSEEGATFSGNALGFHGHNIQQTSHSTSGSNFRLYFNTSSIVGTFQVGETVTGGTSGNTAVVGSAGLAVVFSTSALVVTGPTGNFQLGETVTGGTSGATGVLHSPIYQNWQLAPDFIINSFVTSMTTNTNQALTQRPADTLITTGTFRFLNLVASLGVETLRSDGFTSVVVDGVKSLSSASAGTPSGTITGGGGEVPNGTDLSAVLSSVTATVFGY